MNIGVALVYKYTVGKTMQEHNLGITIGPVNHSGEGFQVSIEPGNAVSSDYLFSVGGCKGYIHPSMISVRVLRWQEFKGGKITGDTVVELPKCTGYSASYEGIRTAESFDKWVTIQVSPNKKPTDAMSPLTWASFAEAIRNIKPSLMAFTVAINEPIGPQLDLAAAEEKTTIADQLCQSAKVLENALTTLSIAQDTEDDYLITCAEQGLEHARNEMAEFIALFENS